MSLWLTGIGVSRGIAIGRVQKLHGGDLEIPEYSLPPSDIDGEVVRFYGAQRRAKEQLREQVASLVVSGAEKILRREINAQAHADILATIKQDL